MASLRHLAAFVSLQALVLLPAAAQGQLWIQQLGTAEEDWVAASAPKGTLGVYLAGWTNGSLGRPHAGSGDAWLALYGDDGAQRWVRQLGTSAPDAAWAAAPDGESGVYVAGHTQGAIGGQLTGYGDAWIARYDRDGNQLWIRQFGEPLRSLFAKVAAPDGAGGAFVGGSEWNGLMFDAWLARYDAEGNQLWLREFGSTEDDEPLAAAPDGSGGVFLTGYTRGALGGPFLGNEDAWLARYDGSGNQLWIRQFGYGGHDRAPAAATDGAGGVFVAGYTGYSDNWLLRYDGDGNRLWERIFGTFTADFLFGAAPDGAGGVHLTGYTLGNYAAPNAGLQDVWIGRFDSAGAASCVEQLGTSQEDRGLTAAADGAGGAYVSGVSLGALGGPHQGERDVWVGRYDGSCAPCGATTYCSSKTNSQGCKPAIQASGTPSLSAGSFTITTTQLLAGQFGVYVYGKSGASSAPFQGGILCVTPPVQRTPPMDSGGSGPCGGTFQLDFNAYAASGADPGLYVGQQLWLQAWSRDPGFAPPDNSSLSDAVTFILCP